MRMSSCNIETFLHSEFYLLEIKLSFFRRPNAFLFRPNNVTKFAKEMKSFSFLFLFKLLTKEVAENLNQDFKTI